MIMFSGLLILICTITTALVGATSGLAWLGPIGLGHAPRPLHPLVVSDLWAPCPLGRGHIGASLARSNWIGPCSKAFAPARGFPACLERIIAKARVEHVFASRGFASYALKAVFLGEHIFQAARQPAKGSLIDILPEAARD